MNFCLRLNIGYLIVKLHNLVSISSENREYYLFFKQLKVELLP